MTTPVSLADWQAEGRRLFDGDIRRWMFVCPSCGQRQSAADFILLGIPKWERYLAYSCIGRFHLNKPEAADNVVVDLGKPSIGWGCTYSGSRDLAPVLLEISPGEIRRTFAFSP